MIHLYTLILIKCKIVQLSKSVELMKLCTILHFFGIQKKLRQCIRE